MKYEKMIMEKHLPMTEEEVKVEKNFNHNVNIVIPFKTDVDIRNTYKDRVSANSIGISVNKCTGYIDNYDWIRHKAIDPTKDIKDYSSAPDFQYAGNIYINGTQIRFRCRNVELIHGGLFFYGTEISDFDFEINEALYEIFRKILR